MKAEIASFLRAWLAGYYRPHRLIEALSGRRTPAWGLAGQSLRALLDALLLYLPLALLGRQPTTPSALTWIPTGRYYAALVWLAPLVLLGQWLIVTAAMHLMLRLLGRPSQFDHLLNLTGLVALVVGAFLLIWDWLWLLLGGHDPVLLGLCHLLIDCYAVYLTTLGLRRLLDVPVWLGVALNLLGLALGLPIAMLFMRAPV